MLSPVAPAVVGRIEVQDAVHRVDDRADRRCGFGEHRVGRAEQCRQLPQIDVIRVDRRIGVRCELEHCGLGLRQERRRDRGFVDQRPRQCGERRLEFRHRGEVDEAQRDPLVGAGFGGLRREPVDDALSQFRRGRPGVGGPHVERPVVPTVARLEFGRRDHEVGVFRHHGRDLERRHQARVEADQVDGVEPDRRQSGAESGIDVGQVEDVVAVRLVGSHAGPAGSVIPQHDGVPLRGVVGDPGLDERGQGVG